MLGHSLGKPVYVKFDQFELTGRNEDFTLCRQWLDNNKNRIMSEIGASNITSNGSNITVTLNNGQQQNYTWHHHQDARTMMLVEQDIHNATRHSGGRHVINHNNYILNTGRTDTEGFVFYLSPY